MRYSQRRDWKQRALSAAAVALLGCMGQRTPPVQGRAPSPDPNRAEIKHLFAALTVDGSDVERRFSARLREVLPPALLRAGWHSLSARYGALESFAVLGEDDRYGKRRYTVELDFSQRSIQALCVFEPGSGELVGLFFSKPPSPQRKTPDGGQHAGGDVEEILLTVGDTALPLGATLALPRVRNGARLPAVVLVAGSGPIDRDGTLQGARPYRDLAEGLARRNVVSLRFDKRPFTYPRQYAGKVATVEQELLADAVSAVNTLRLRPEVDPRRLFVLGHSLGALLAPEIAERAGDVAGLILVAAPGRPLPEILLEQLRDGGEKPADLAPLERQLKALSTAPPEQVVLGMPAGYWQDVARRDEFRIARRLAVPTLYVRGALDHNVLSVDQERWAQAFAGDARFESLTLPGLNHLLMPAAAGLAGDVHVPDEVIEKLASFIAGAVPPAPAAPIP
jgi:pimeloyl-ACP methyl ester carboxylesterase